jgi:hypothetical protein
MDISPAHAQAVFNAIRVPSLHVRQQLLQADPNNTVISTIAIYGTEKPAPGASPGADPVVVIPMTVNAVVVDEENFRLVIETPIEAPVVGADFANGTTVLWARIFTPALAWWADLSVSPTGGGGEIQLAATTTENGQPVVRLFNGATARITSGVFQG